MTSDGYLGFLGCCNYEKEVEIVFVRKCASVVFTLGKRLGLVVRKIGIASYVTMIE